MGIYNYGKIELGYFEESIGFIRQLDDKGIHPIPLTEEILLKCGFEKDYEGHFLLAFNGRLYYYDLENGFLLKDFKVKTKLNQFPFYNLHQLQNLIFILTNTELNITL